MCRTKKLLHKFDFYKIGRTYKSGKTRVNEWENESNEDYFLVEDFYTQYPKYFEYLAHEWLKDVRTVYTDRNNEQHIEWFEEEYEKVKSVITKINSYLTAFHKKG
jgi:hypothetical protein